MLQSLRSQAKDFPKVYRNIFLVTLSLAVTTICSLAFVRSVESGSGLDSGTVRNVRKSPHLSASEYVPSLGPAALITIDVDRTDDDPSASACTAAPNDCSVRGAVTFANSNPGTTINVPAGTYQLTIPGGFAEGFNGDNSVGDLDVTANNTAIVGAGAASTIVQQTQPNDRVIEVNPFLDAGFNFSLSGVTISGGRETTGVGGGGLISGSVNNTTTLSDCIFSGNSASGANTFGGGGVSTAGGSLNISNCAFNNNSTTGSGGGISYSAGDPLGRTPSSGTFDVAGSSFTGNTANSTSSGGGAIDLFNFNQGTGSYTIDSSSFHNNRALAGQGGAILVESGPLDISTSSFTANQAAGFGGAIYAVENSNVSYSRLVGNSVTTPANGMAIFRAGGIFTANDNWWGLNNGPQANDFRQDGGSSVTPLSWLQLRHVASPDSICVGANATLNADIKGRSSGGSLTNELDGLPAFAASFVNGTPALGSVSGGTNFINGAATATFTAGASNGAAIIDVTADSETVAETVSIDQNTTTALADQAVCEGGTAVFSTTGSGPGAFTFVWQQGATVLNNGDLGGRVSIVSGANASTLTITNVQPGDVGAYSVAATGECNTDTKAASLSLLEDTTTTDPADVSVCPGVAASFSTTASGVGPFSYSWTVDGNPFGGDTSSINVPTDSLSIGDHTVEVTVTGACGSATQTATLTIQEPTTTTDPADVIVCQGATAEFSTTPSGAGPFTYAWTVDGTPFGGNTPSISVPTEALSVGGHTVEVTVTGACGSATQTASLTVQETTSATTPASQAVCQGALANFATTASGTGPFTYQWRVDGNNIDGATDANVAINTSSLSAGDHLVEVVVNGTCGSVIRSTTLTVNTAPQVTLNPVSQTVTSGNVTFTAAASGNPLPGVQWQVSTDDGATFSNIPGANSTSLTFATDPSQNGNQYRAVFTNECGVAITTAATLTTCTPPVITLSTTNINLWPPNHNYHTFNVTDFVASVTSNCDANLLDSVTISSVSSDEPEENPTGGDGNSFDDIVIAPNCKSVQLRAERDSKLNGRVYTLTFTVTDSAGNTTTATAKVSVPTNNGGTAVDNGPNAGYTVNGNCP